MSTVAAAERDAVLAVYDGAMSAGTVWHIIDSEWLHQWAAYVGIDLTTRQPIQPTASTPPPHIPNERLRDPTYPTLEFLRPHLLEGSDYELVPHSVAELLFQRYGTPTTPRFIRSVIEIGSLAKEQRVDVRPAILTLVPLSDSGEERDSDVEVMTYASNTKWSEIRDMLINAEKSNDIYDEVTAQTAQHSTALHCTVSGDGGRIRRCFALVVAFAADTSFQETATPAALQPTTRITVSPLDKSYSCCSRSLCDCCRRRRTVVWRASPR